MAEWLRQHDVSRRGLALPRWRMLSRGESAAVKRKGQPTTKSRQNSVSWKNGMRIQETGGQCLVASFHLSILGPHGEVTAAIPRGNLLTPSVVGVGGSPLETPPRCKQIHPRRRGQVRGKVECALPGSLYFPPTHSVPRDATLSLARLSGTGIPRLASARSKHPSSSGRSRHQQQQHAHAPPPRVAAASSRYSETTTQLHLCVSSH
ncbi:hypothetical protein QBC39DRAFT_361215 [Podospora conica]|nr:hypothetical protein QBC39DRAFT_361215 [Schizothecium conicum]